MRTHYCGLLNADQLDQTVSLCGWAHRRRDHGGVIFIDLRDREGLVQIVCDPDRPEMFKTAEGVRNEFCLKIVGKVRPRPAGTSMPMSAAAAGPNAATNVSADFALRRRCSGSSSNSHI